MKNTASKIILSLMVVSIGLFASCRDENSDSQEEMENTTPPAPNQDSDTTAGNNATAAVNPAHGEAGHRCDIPVGAPLNQASSQQSSTTTQQMNQSPVRVKNSSSAKINPAHGEPGHDCSVPVGAELGQ